MIKDIILQNNDYFSCFLVSYMSYFRNRRYRIVGAMGCWGAYIKIKATLIIFFVAAAVYRKSRLYGLVMLDGWWWWISVLLISIPWMFFSLNTFGSIIIIVKLTSCTGSSMLWSKWRGQVPSFEKSNWICQNIMEKACVYFHLGVFQPLLNNKDWPLEEQMFQTFP